MLPIGYFPITSWQSWAVSPTPLACFTLRLQPDLALPRPRPLPLSPRSLTFLPLGPLQGLHAPQPLHFHLSLQPFPHFPWRESQGKNEEPFSRLNGKAGHTELKGYMSLKIEKQKVKKWNREPELWGHSGKWSNTHAIDRGPGSLA